MAITPLPTPPARSMSSDAFVAAADAFLGALPTFATEANTAALAMNLNSTADTSASSVLIGTGAKTFTVTAGKSFQGGMWLVIADTAAPSTNSMMGQVTSYSGTTLVMNITSVIGSGTKTAWTISQSSASSFDSVATTVAICSAATTLNIGSSGGNINTGGTVTLGTAASTANHAVRLAQIQSGSIPCFSAYSAATTSLISGVFTKVTFGTEQFDTTNAFDSVTNNRFQPTVAGYYLVSGGVQMVSTATSIYLHIYKTGVDVQVLASVEAASGMVYGSCLMYLNGSTDYIELWCKQLAATQNNINSISSIFQACLVLRA